uniref:RNA helicase n=1 Tax=Trypanosoma congolense (strain IL3000) TaxID=1068625 RepID=G0URZ0_TRYCI|nr:putative ATP-dependent DEAD/H RNA helicase [Trypanosoma congolense IL3000]
MRMCRTMRTCLTRRMFVAHCCRTASFTAYWSMSHYQFRQVNVSPPGIGDNCAALSPQTMKPDAAGAVSVENDGALAHHHFDSFGDVSEVSMGFGEDGTSTSETAVPLYGTDDFNSRLYGEDPRASITDTNRVFGSSAPNSYNSTSPVAETGQYVSKSASASEDANFLRDRRITDSPPPAGGVAEAVVAVGNVSSGSTMGLNPRDIPSLQSHGHQNAANATSQATQSVDEILDLSDDRVVNEELASMDYPHECVEDMTEATFVVHDHMRNTVAVHRLSSFEHLMHLLPPWLQRGLMSSGYTAPSLVQSVAIPLFLGKHDVVGVAPTGSGKTVAFALPALASLARQTHTSGGVGESPAGCRVGRTGEREKDQVKPRVLVLCPTRELVQQTSRVFSLLSSNAVRISGMYGGQDRSLQLEHVRHMRGCDVLVATPGRLCDFVEAQEVNLRLVDFLIMDEADRMLELGFAPQLEFIMSHMRKFKRRRQTTMWTATWNATVGGLATRFMLPERLLLEVDRDRKVNPDITQRMYGVSDPSQRIQVIAKLYDDGVINRKQQVLIFANRKEEVEWLANELSKALRAPPNMLKCLHGGMRQKRREAVTRGFSCNEIRVLCATDVAARGIDVPGLSHVINYDLPAHVDAYIHRIGRTGRAGRAGTAHTFIVAGDSRAPSIARFIAQQQGRTTLPDDVLAIVQDTERCGATEPERQRYKLHSSVVGRDWRLPAGRGGTPTQGSRYVRGVGRVVTLKRPATRK